MEGGGFGVLRSSSLHSFTNCHRTLEHSPPAIVLKDGGKIEVEWRRETSGEEKGGWGGRRKHAAQRLLQPQTRRCCPSQRSTVSAIEQYRGTVGAAAYPVGEVARVPCPDDNVPVRQEDRIVRMPVPLRSDREQHRQRHKTEQHRCGFTGVE